MRFEVGNSTDTLAERWHSFESASDFGLKSHLVEFQITRLLNGHLHIKLYDFALHVVKSFLYLKFCVSRIFLKKFVVKHTWKKITIVKFA